MGGYLSHVLASLCKGLLTEGGGSEARDLQPRQELKWCRDWNWDFDCGLLAGESGEAAAGADVGEGFMETVGVQASKWLQSDLAEFDTWIEGNQY